MTKRQKSHNKPRPEVYLIIIAVTSFLVLAFSTYLIVETPTVSTGKRIFCMFLIQISCGFFFTITIGKIIQWIHSRDNAAILWDFISECGEAGLQKFYASREGSAKKDLGERFKKHKRGDILMMGASLREFLSHNGYFYEIIKECVPQYDRFGVTIRAINSAMGKNRSLPIRAFVEEFEPNGELPGGVEGKSREKFCFQTDSFDWTSTIVSTNSLDLENFINNFYDLYGKGGQKETCRCINDLNDVLTGIRQLNSQIERRLIHARTSKFEPYFTAVIFPDICYYTPNLLSPDHPVNMPMLSFVSGKMTYQKIIEHFKFLWWSGEDIKTQLQGKQT